MCVSVYVCVLTFDSINDNINDMSQSRLYFCIFETKHATDFDKNTSEQLSSPRLCLWFSPASCTEQQQGRTITFGAQRGGGW